MHEYEALMRSAERMGVEVHPSGAQQSHVQVKGARRGVSREPYEFKSYHRLVTSSQGFRLTTASPVQKAIQYSVDGYKIPKHLWSDPNVQEVCGKNQPPPVRPAEVVLVCGIRSGKSLHAAAAGIHMAMTCLMEQTSGAPLGPGDIPRVSIVSPVKDTSIQTYNHMVGGVMNSPFLRDRLLADPTSDSLVLMHPTGRPVEVKIVAGSRAGTTLVSRWSAGVIFDEAPRMQSIEDGVVNLEDMRASVRFRLLRKAQIWYVGSPHAPSGYVYDLIKTYFGKETPDHLRLFVATSDQMNPEQWTPEVIADAYAADPEKAAVELGAKFMAPETTLLSPQTLDDITREGPLVLPYDPERTYVATMDPATRGNGWTLCIATRVDGKFVVALVKEWRSQTAPLRPKEVLAEIAGICREYQIYEVYSDQWSSDAIRDLAEEVGLTLFQEDLLGNKKTTAYLSFARWAEVGRVELPPDPKLQKDLQNVRKRPAGTGVKVVLPLTSDGRHCDHASSVVLAADQYIAEMTEPQENPAVKLTAAVKEQDVDEFEAFEAGQYDEELEEYGWFFEQW